MARQISNVALVPSVNIGSCKRILKARLTAAAAFEDALQVFLAQGETSTDLTLFAANAIDQNRNALTEYAFLESNAREASAKAIEAFNVAKTNYTKQQEKLNDASQNFKKGIQQWKSTEQQKAIWETVGAVIEVAVAIAEAVASGGLATPAAVGAVTKAAGTVGQVAGMIAKITEVLDKLKKIKEKFEPLFNKLKGLVSAVQKILAIIESAKDITDMPSQLEPADPESDPINANATWDAFTVDVEAMFKELESFTIPDKDDYRTQLLNLPIFAKAYLMAQVAVVTTGQNLAGIILHRKLDNEQHTRLENTLKHISSNNVVLSLLQRAMFDRVLALRNLVYVDFWNYKAAFQYHALSTELDGVVGTSAVQPVTNHQMDAARLQAAVSSFGATVRIQRRTFTLTVPLDKVQKKSLLQDGTLIFEVSPREDTFRGFCRIRMSRARAFLERVATGSTDAPVRLQLRTSGRFLDRDFPLAQRPSATDLRLLQSDLLIRRSNGSVNSEPVADGADLVEPPLYRAFIGEPRSIAFEYAAGNGASSGREVICDGWFGLQDDFTMQTPFQEWTLRIKSMGASTGAGSKADLSAVTAVRWEFYCEVCAVD